MNAPMPMPQQGQPVPAPQMPMPMPMQAAPQPMPAPVTHDVTIIRTKKYAQAKALGVPPEEWGIERNARDIKTCNYCFHDVVTKTRSDLIAEGYDEDQVNALPEYMGLTNIEEMARDSVWEHASGASGSSNNNAAQVVKLTEHYCRLDYEGNGKPKLYQIVTGGNDGEVMKRDGEDAVIEFDAMPFAAITPVPVTHRFFGRSIADLVMPVQREKTAMKRGALDNLYLHNNPRVGVAEQGASANTLDDLLVSRPGGIVRTKANPAEVLAWQVVPDITGSIFPMLQYLDAELETRTGLAKQTQGIDSNALQNQSATAVAQVFSASQMRMKLIARVMAEGIKDMFSLLHATIRKHGQQAQTVRLRNTWVQVDPREWQTRDDMTINVGLGTGSKAQQFAQISALGEAQGNLLKMGKSNLVDDTALFNTFVEMARLMGHKNADKFINDPSAKDPQTGQPLHPPPQPPPDPKVMAVQAQSQADQAEIQLKAQLDKQKAQDAAQLAQFKAEIDAKLKMVDAHLKALESARKAGNDQQQHRAHMAETVIGMVADAHSHDLKTEQAQQAHEAKLQQMKQKPAPKAGD